MVFLTPGIPAVIVGLIAAIRPNTFDMGKAQYEDVTCGSLNFTAEIQRTRYDSSLILSTFKAPKHYQAVWLVRSLHSCSSRSLHSYFSGSRSSFSFLANPIFLDFSHQCYIWCDTNLRSRRIKGRGWGRRKIGK